MEKKDLNKLKDSIMEEMVEEYHQVLDVQLMLS
jgi:hypothetical protein